MTRQDAEIRFVRQGEGPFTYRVDGLSYELWRVLERLGWKWIDGPRGAGCWQAPNLEVWQRAYEKLKGAGLRVGYYRPAKGGDREAAESGEDAGEDRAEGASCEAGSEGGE